MKQSHIIKSNYDHLPGIMQPVLYQCSRCGHSSTMGGDCTKCSQLDEVLRKMKKAIHDAVKSVKPS